MTAKRSKAAALAMLMAGAFCAGAWLLISPIFEKQRMLDRQDELLDSISNGSGVIALEESFPAGYVDFFDMGGATTDVYSAHRELTEAGTVLRGLPEPEIKQVLPLRSVPLVFSISNRKYMLP